MHFKCLCLHMSEYIFFGLFYLGKSCWQIRGNIRRKRPRKRCSAWRSWSRREKIRNPNGSSLTIKPIPRIKKDRCVWEKLKSFFVFNPAIMLKFMIIFSRWRGAYLHLQRVWMEKLALAHVVLQINPWPSTMTLQNIMSGTWCPSDLPCVLSVPICNHQT